MITKSKSYTTSDGKTFTNITEAQANEITCLIGPSASSVDAIASLLVSKRDEVIAILKVRERKARKSKAPKNGKATPKNETPAD